MISISSSFGFSGEITKLFPCPLTSTIVDAVETKLFFSNVNVSVLSLKTTTSSTCISPLLIFLDCTKNLTNVSSNGTFILPVRLASLSENSSLMSSILRTLFVLHCTKFASLVFTNWINFDLVPLSIVSMSLPRSKLWIASTLCSVITSAETIVTFNGLTPIDAVDDIPASAKFFKPLVCNNLFTGSTISLNVFGLCTVYERFW